MRKESQTILKLYLYNKTSNIKCPTSKDRDKLQEYRTQLQYIIELYQDAGDFDLKGFFQKYGLKRDDSIYRLYFWELAEEASQTDDRFGKPDPKLILQLVLLGGYALSDAVKFAYGNFKKGIVEPFVMDDWVASGAAISYCAARKEEKYKEKDKEDLKKIKSKFDAKGQKFLMRR